MEENSNVKGRKTLKNPTPGNPAPSSSKGNPKTSKKRKNLGPTGSGLTPEDKKQQQGNSSVKQPGLVPQSPGFTIPKVSSETGGNSTQNSEVSAKEKDNSDVSSRAGSNRSLRTNSEDSHTTNPPLPPAKEDSSKPDSDLLLANEEEEQMDLTASPRSVSSLMKESNLLDTDDEGEKELGDLSEEAEDAIAQKELGLDTKEDDSGNEPPLKTKKTTYASKVAAEPKAKALKGFEVLYIHQGEKERGPISRETFHKLWDRFQTLVVDQILQGKTVPDEINWRSWSQGRGLVSVKDKATSDYVCQQISQIKIKKNTFRAWHRGEFSEGKLATGFVEGAWAKMLTPDKLMQVLMSQNKLKGRFTGTTSKVEEKGRLLKFFADQDLWDDLLARRQSQGLATVRLKMGVSPIFFTLSKAKRDAAKESKDESEVSKPGGSNHSEQKPDDDSETPSPPTA